MANWWGAEWWADRWWGAEWWADRWWGAQWWDVLQALGTVGATAVALFLAAAEGWRARNAEKALAEERKTRKALDRVATASLVSTWVEINYEPSTDGTHYIKRGTVFVANESNEPVFDVRVVIGVGNPPIQIGPLAVPTPIPVLPPRRQRSWDVSLGLLAHAESQGLLPVDPVALLDFSDVHDVRWHRDFEGRLTDSPPESPAPYDLDPDDGAKQLGNPSNAFNPIWTAMAFLSLIQREDPPCEISELRPLLAEKAFGWDDLTPQDLSELRDDLNEYGLATHCAYPAPQIAYVRLIHEEDAKRPIGAAGYRDVRAMLITLVFYVGQGWRVFSAGGAATPADWIEFPPGSISDDPRFATVDDTSNLKRRRK